MRDRYVRGGVRKKKKTGLSKKIIYFFDGRSAIRFSLIFLNSSRVSRGHPRTADTHARHPGSFRSQGSRAEFGPGRMQRNNCREEERKGIFSVPTKP